MMSRYPTAGVVVTHYNPPHKSSRAVASMTIAAVAKLPAAEIHRLMERLSATFAAKK
jgi:hypothetical protein